MRTVEKYGNLDIVVNNAGIVDEIDWERTVNINLVWYGIHIIGHLVYCVPCRQR